MVYDSFFEKSLLSSHMSHNIWLIHIVRKQIQFQIQWKKNFENPSKHFQDIEELRNSRVQKIIKSLWSSPMTHLLCIIYIILKHFLSRVGNNELQRNSDRDEVILTGYDVIKKAKFSQFKLVLYKNNLYNKFYTASNGAAKTLRPR